MSTLLMHCSRFVTKISAALGLFLLALYIPGALAEEPDNQSTAVSQQARSEAAMERSIAAQQAVTAFREEGEASSLRQQRESIGRQNNVIEGFSEPVTSGSAGQYISAQPNAKAFFALPWPSSVPLAVPNVQMVDDSCQPMPNDQVETLIQAVARKHAIEPSLLKAVMRQESAFKPCAVSTAGAMGLMQIMPETADMLGLNDPFNPAENTDAGARFLKMMLDRYKGNVPMALGAYNAGPGRVDETGGVPPISETLEYVANILRNISLVY